MNKQKMIEKLFKITDERESIGDTITDMAALLDKTNKKNLKEELALLFLYRSAIWILDANITNTGGQIDFEKNAVQSSLIVEHISDLEKTKNCIAAWGKNLYEKILYTPPKKAAAPKKVEKKVEKKKTKKATKNAPKKQRV